MSLEVKVQSWDNIENHYISLIRNGWQHERLLELVKFLRNSKLSSGLVAFTSLDDLYLSNYTPMEWKRDMLRIHFDRANHEWLFEYYSQPMVKPQFVRTYPADQGITKFDEFLKKI